MNNQSRILVIDDDENITKVVSAILKEEGYDVESAGTGGEAVKKSQKTHYDLMLIDVRLPDMDGTELLTKVRDTMPRIRKVIVTGYPTLQNAVAALNKGADAYVMKPFDVEKMLNTVKEQLERQKQERKFSEDRVAEFIETRIKEMDHEEPRIAKNLRTL
ncbi:MAG TPA: response regulator [Candidatus Bathyarchaeia archaeon]|nr:response regulator [Candidatus Bathyarchaeia archaeon]